MSRTGEIILGVIGIILCAIGILFGMFFLFAGTSEDVRNEVLYEDPTLAGEIDLVMGMFSGLGWGIIIAALIGIVAGIIAVIYIAGNKNPKVAGWLFIIGGILTGLISFGSGFLAALLYVIAGIMYFVRKPKDETTTIQPS